MTMPGVSVIMPVYNGSRYLLEAAESILAQTYQDFEFICIDDGSTDDSLQPLRQLERRDPRVRVITRANKGLPRTLNEGIALAKAPLIARMDADDIALATRFEKQVAHLQDNPRCVIVGSRVTTIDPYGSAVWTSEQPTDHESIVRDLLHGIGWSIVHPAAMIRKSALEQIAGYREQFSTSQDLDLFLRLAEVGELANLAEPLLQYRVHCESATFRKFQEQEKFRHIILREAHERRGLPAPAPQAMFQRTYLPIGEQIRRWAWTALKKGNVKVARRHARDCLKHDPLALETWRLLYCAIRGR
jgi:glycosyltransferase involved in cell wall biosynthesis